MTRFQRPWLAVLLLWLACSTTMLLLYWPGFAELRFRDPDDAMRLAQVRDFLHGQNWFDVSQHRVNPPFGGPMHWSRIVDLPIAGLILLFQPFTGTALAERIACVADPLLLLAALSFTYFPVARRLGSDAQALLGLALLLCALPILIQFTPLRIDHHDWQIWMAAAALGGALHPDARRGGLIAGCAVAFWLHVSSEGLPYAALFGALFALRHAFEAAERPRLHGYAYALAFGSALLLVGTRGWPEVLATHCDSISPVYLAPMLAVAVLIFAAGHVLGQATTLRRLAVASIAGAGGIAVFLFLGSSCLAGPFKTLDPVVYRFWYLQVLEGRPIWEQGLPMAGVILLPSLLGIAGTIAALRTAPDRQMRIRWLSLLMLAIGALLVSILVMRAMAVAHLFALPGTAWLLIRLYIPVSARPSAATRVLLTVALALATPLGVTALWTALIPQPAPAKDSDDGSGCSDRARLAMLAKMPPTVFFAPIDMGPDILVTSRHSVIATAHHRNIAGLGAVIRGYMQRPDAARATIARTQARYLLFCPGLNEIRKYAKVRPNSLAALLEHNRAPGWLERQSIPGLAPLRLYRITPE